MAAWFRSSKGALTLSFLALISLMVRSYVDTRFILVEDFSHLGRGFALLWILVYTAIVSGWMWGLIAAAQGKRVGMIVLLIYALLCALGFGAGSLIAYASEPAEVVIFGSSLITGILASIAAGLQLRNPGERIE